MRAFQCLLIAAMLLSCCAKPPVKTQVSQSPSEFTENFVSKLRVAIPDATIETTGELAVKVDTTSVSLHNMYRQYQLDVSSSDELVDSQIKALLESRSNSNSDKSIDIEKVLPVVRDFGFVDEMKKALKTPESAVQSEIYFEPFNDQLAVLYAEDGEMTVRYLNKNHIESLGLSSKELRAKAVKNLEKLTAEMQIMKSGETYFISAGAVYETSLMLIDSLWNKKTFKVDGDIVVAIPSRDEIYVVGNNDVAGVEKLRDIAQKSVATSSHTITEDLFVRRDGKWLLLKE